MDRQLRKQIAKIDEKIAKAKASNNLLKVIQYTAEKNKLLEPQIIEQRMTLKQALDSYTQEERNKATAEVIYIVATAKILYDSVISVQDMFLKKFDVGLPMLEDMRSVANKLLNVVKTIDSVSDKIFLNSYDDVISEVEIKYRSTMMNYIYNEIVKLVKKTM